MITWNVEHDMFSSKPLRQSSSMLWFMSDSLRCTSCTVACQFFFFFYGTQSFMSALMLSFDYANVLGDTVSVNLSMSPII